MVSCIPITQEQIRAEVWMGDTLLAKTPFINSFNVSKGRGQLSGTFNVTFEMIAGTQFPIGQRLVIKAGTKGNLKSIYTGFIETTKISPAHAKPSYFSVNLGGQGVLSQLENKKFTRRLKSDGQGMFCLITGGSSNRPSSVMSLDRTHSSGNRTATNLSPNPATGGGEQSQWTKYVGGAGEGGATGSAASRLATKPSGGPDANAGSSGSGLGVHTHEDLDNGGPAFGVYSAD
jgi:hypothetical protein